MGSHRHQAHAGQHGAVTPHASARALGVALGLTIAFAAVEAAVGLFANSLALLADAGHMLSDAAALAIALCAIRLGRRPPTPKATYGFRRAEILAALLNAAVLATIAIFVTRAAIMRWSSPADVRGPEVMVAAVLGLGVNLLAARFLHGSAAENLNTRAAYLHVIGDALGSVGALTSGALVTVFGWNRADPVLSVAISLILVYSAWRLIRETTQVLMEAVPVGFDVSAIERAILEVPGVASVHDLHVWSITAGMPALTAHVVLSPGAHGVPVTSQIARVLATRFGIDHSTIQPESGPDGGKLVTIATRKSA